MSSDVVKSCRLQFAVAASLIAGLVGATLGVSDATAARPLPFQRGMTLADWGKSGYPTAQTKMRLRQMKNHRVTSVTLLQVWNQESKTSAEVSPGNSTVSDDRLSAAIRYARALKLRVVLRPYVDLVTGWRGMINPADPDAWFASYSRFAVRYARFAQAQGVSVFVFATEMKTLSINPEMAPRWLALMRSVRSVFKGPVVYEANWDEVLSQNAAWMRSLDAIGISAYFPICSEPTSSVPVLREGWARWVDQLSVAHQRLAKPFLFTEIGYRSIPGACQRPWDRSTWAGQLSPLDQAAAVEAALRVWWRVPWFKGMHWYTQTPLTSGPNAKGYEFGTEAWRALRDWYGHTAAGQI